MVRSAAAIIAVLILPGFALAQQPQGSHTVVRDDTLWDLAQRYYASPFQWRTIWEANRSVINDPNLIYPSQVLTIPGVPAQQTTAQPPPPGTGDPGARPPETGTPPAQPDPAADAEVRTIFYRNQMAAPSVVSMLEREYVAVDRDQMYSAPWLGPIEGMPRHMGTLVGFALSSDRGSTLRQFHQVSVRTSAPARVGEQLRAFRVTRSIPQVGKVVMPTGLLTITAVHDSGAVAVVTKEYGRIQPGDLVEALPAFEVAVGVRAQDVTGGSEAMIMGFASNSQLKDLGQHAFLDLGTDHGIGVGDEFVLFSEAARSDVRGRLQVVSVTAASATARVMSLVDDVFRQGVIVQLVRQMP